jgi:hypothetical protein
MKTISERHLGSWHTHLADFILCTYRQPTRNVTGKMLTTEGIVMKRGFSRQVSSWKQVIDSISIFQEQNSLLLIARAHKVVSDLSLLSRNQIIILVKLFF